MTSKWVGDAFGKDGIYAVWIAMRRYPWLPPADYHDKGETGALLMTPFSELVVIQDEACTIANIRAHYITCCACYDCLTLIIGQLLQKHSYHGFPVVRGLKLVGYVTRNGLEQALGSLDRLVPPLSSLTRCCFRRFLDYRARVGFCQKMFFFIATFSVAEERAHRPSKYD